MTNKSIIELLRDCQGRFFGDVVMEDRVRQAADELEKGEECEHGVQFYEDGGYRCTKCGAFFDSSKSIGTNMPLPQPKNRRIETYHDFLQGRQFKPEEAKSLQDYYVLSTLERLVEAHNYE